MYHYITLYMLVYKCYVQDGAITLTMCLTVSRECGMYSWCAAPFSTHYFWLTGEGWLRLKNSLKTIFCLLFPGIVIGKMKGKSCQYFDTKCKRNASVLSKLHIVCYSHNYHLLVINFQCEACTKKVVRQMASTIKMAADCSFRICVWAFQVRDLCLKSWMSAL